MKYNRLTFIKAECTTVIGKALIKAFISFLDRIHHMSHLMICQRLENMGGCGTAAPEDAAYSRSARP